MFIVTEYAALINAHAFINAHRCVVYTTTLLAFDFTTNPVALHGLVVWVENVDPE